MLLRAAQPPVRVPMQSGMFPFYCDVDGRWCEMVQEVVS